MKSTGIIRKVDELGRVVIPKEIRDTQEIVEGTLMEVFIEGDKIIFKKFVKMCSFCDSTKDLIDFKEKPICPKCMKQIIQLPKAEQNVKENFCESI